MKQESFLFNYYKIEYLNNGTHDWIVINASSDLAATNLFQAAKCVSKSDIIKVKKLSDNQAKKLGFKRKDYSTI